MVEKGKARRSKRKEHMQPAAKLKTQSCLVEFVVTAPPGMTQPFVTKALANIEFSTKVSKWLTVSEAAQLKKVRQATLLQPPSCDCCGVRQCEQDMRVRVVRVGHIGRATTTTISYWAAVLVQS